MSRVRRTGHPWLYDYALITDTHGSEIRVRESSAYERCVWILSERDGRAPHLNVEQAKRLRDALQRFIDGAEKEALGG